MWGGGGVVTGGLLIMNFGMAGLYPGSCLYKELWVHLIQTHKHRPLICPTSSLDLCVLLVWARD